MKRGPDLESYVGTAALWMGVAGLVITFIGFRMLAGGTVVLVGVVLIVASIGLIILFGAKASLKRFLGSTGPAEAEEQHRRRLRILNEIGRAEAGKVTHPTAAAAPATGPLWVREATGTDAAAMHRLWEQDGQEGSLGSGRAWVAESQGAIVGVAIVDRAGSVIALRDVSIVRGIAGQNIGVNFIPKVFEAEAANGRADVYVACPAHRVGWYLTMGFREIPAEALPLEARPRLDHVPDASFLTRST